MRAYKTLFSVLFVAVFMTGCPLWDDPEGGGGTAVATAPSVSFTVPLNAATNVYLNSKVTATFSEAMDSETITAVTFILKRGVVAVAGAVAYTGVTAVFTPASNLLSDTEYTAVISAGAKNTAGTALSGVKTWNFTTGSTVDTTAPTVSSTVPADAVTDVAINQALGATFSEAMDPLTITDATFTLTSAAGAVSGVVSYAGLTAVFTPASNLAASTLYTATITTGVADLTGNYKVANKVWTFTTGTTADTTAPTVSSTIPADVATSVAINLNVSAAFSEAMNPLTITNVIFTLAGPGATSVAGAVTYVLVGNNAIFNPDANLLPDTLYTATISTSATDLAGNALAANKVWTFTTAASADTTAPTVTLTGPEDADLDVAINRNVTATFSEDMDPLTMVIGSWTLTKADLVPVDGSFDYVLATRVATFNPDANLDPNTVYTATLTTGVNDLAQNAMASDYVWSFTTGAGDFIIGAPAQDAVPLGDAGPFAILAKAAITNIPTSAITGDVATSPITGAAITGFSDPLTCPEVVGTIYASNAAGPACAVDVSASADPSLITNAQTAALDAYTDAVAAARGTPQSISGNLNGLTLYPGLYESGTSVEISPGGFLYLDAQGDSSAVFVIRSATTITTEATSEVVLAGAANANNVYWVAGSAVTLGANSIMKGTIIASTAVTLQTGANLEGRALNQGAAATGISCDSCTITVPTP